MYVCVCLSVRETRQKMDGDEDYPRIEVRGRKRDKKGWGMRSQRDVSGDIYTSGSGDSKDWRETPELGRAREEKEG